MVLYVLTGSTSSEEAVKLLKEANIQHCTVNIEAKGFLNSTNIKPLLLGFLPTLTSPCHRHEGIEAIRSYVRELQ